MLERLRLARRRIRRLVDRSEWSGRLLGPPLTRGPSQRPGLLIVQVDGLSYRLFEEALAAGDVPFLAHLVDDEGYRAHHVYSGLPSTTPAAQAELLYGVRTAVPAFSYRDHRDGHLVRMWQRSDADEVEQRYADRRSLLEGGSSYANVYAGRAHHARFCMASLEWSDPFRTRHPRALPALALLHLPDLVRMVGLGARELADAATTLLEAMSRGQDRRAEVKFALSRVAVGVVVRELCALGATIDVARGLPVVHLNLLGFDEYAHRRGPRSATARRALRDIDRVIERVTTAAWRSGRREYDVWVVADHGQEATEPYEHRHGRTVHEAVGRALGWREPTGGSAWGQPGHHGRRTRVLGERILAALVPAVDRGDRTDAALPLVTAQGPLGHVYLPGAPDERSLAEAARALVHEAGIPLVLAAGAAGTASAWTRHGTFRLPGDAAAVLGADHPYVDEAAADLVALCHHPDAGDLVVSGWDRDDRPMSFPQENGSHGGPGAEETDAVALLPVDTPLHADDGPLRHAELRRTAFALLDAPVRSVPRLRAEPPEQRRRTDVIRVLTYNVHSCVGLDGKLAPERIARVIARHAPDVVALQELDVGRARTGGVDQAARLAELLEMLLHFHPALSVEEERYGDAVLSRLPMRVVRTGALPGLALRPELEPRGAIWVELDAGSATLQLINTHLGLDPWERQRQVDALLGPEWLGSIDPGTPAVLCGDLNSLSWFPECRRIRRRLHDVQEVAVGHRPQGTFGRFATLGRIDHVFVDPSIEVRNVEIPRHALARVASDHQPLLADLRLPDATSTVAPAG